MQHNSKIKKVELSPKLKLGVGRAGNSTNILRISGTLFLVASLILTIRTGFQVFNSSDSKETVQNQAQPKVLGASDNASQSEASQPGETFKTVTVKEGDTVFSIAQKNGTVSWSTIATLNNLKPPFTLQPGQELKLPNQ